MATFVIKPFLQMRSLPTLESKVASQALFGEKVEVLERSGNWVLIQTPDGYRGWILDEWLIERKEPYRGDVEISRLKAHLYGVPDVEYGPILTLPHGVKLQAIESSHPRWVEVLLPDGRKGFIQKGDLAPEPFEFSSFCKQFLGLPYTWGGRSSFGFDCSGFVQMVYKRLGINLPRDARDQFADPRGKKIELKELREGDLLFWGKSEGDIRHVAISLDKEEFIHASTRENKPYLRISKLTDPAWKGDADYPYRAARRLTS